MGIQSRNYSEGERIATLDECFEYDDYLRANGHSTGGEALQPPGNALTLYWRNGKVATTDGPYAETKAQLGGIGVLEARDMNHAIALMSQHPALKYGTIWEIQPAGDMSESSRQASSGGERTRHVESEAPGCNFPLVNASSVVFQK